MLIYILLGIIASVFIFGAIVHYSLDKKKVYRDLRGKHVVVTGGSSGIGKAIAIEAALLGAHVSIIGRNVERLETTYANIKRRLPENTEQKIQYSSLDVEADYEVISECLSTLEKDVGPIFMLVNCAGMCICGEFDKMKTEYIKKMIDLNYFGTAYPTRYVLPGMKERDEGLIVFVSSEAALLGIYGYSAYAAAKFAVRGLAEALFMELVGTNVRLTLAFPSDTDTPGYQIENLSKPIETKMISGTAGLHSPEVVGKKILYDALNGRIYSVVGLSGKLMSLLFCSSIDSAWQVILQIFSGGLLRTVVTGVLMSFNKTVRDEKALRAELDRDCL